MESADEQELAEGVARQWLARYGVVSRDWWRRERPPVSWRAIYLELKRLEFRGDVQRGYFVAGLAGAQFALPEAVEMLRAPSPKTPEAPVVMATSDPANVYSLALEGVERDALTRPRGTGAYIVTIGGNVVLAAEGRGRRLSIRPDTDAQTLTAALTRLIEHLTAPRAIGRVQDLIVETINGEVAAASEMAPLLLEAGLRREGRMLRRHATIK
jgi:ATP-dependent Lhr-like helicase